MTNKEIDSGSVFRGRGADHGCQKQYRLKVLAGMVDGFASLSVRVDGVKRPAADLELGMSPDEAAAEQRREMDKYR